MRNEVVKREMVKRGEMYLISCKRKEKQKYFLRRRHHDQYCMFSREYPDLTGSHSSKLPARSSD